MKYYTAETDANGRVNGENLWKTTGARSLTAAKRVATQRQAFHGTAAHVGERRGNSIVAVAVKRGDALNMNVRGDWVDCE